MQVGTVDRNRNRTRLVMVNDDSVTARSYTLEVELPVDAEVVFKPGDLVTVTIEPKG